MNGTDLVALELGRAIIGASFWLCLFSAAYWFWAGVRGIYRFLTRRFRKEDSLVVSFKAYREMVAAIHAVPIEDYAYYDHEARRAVRKSEIRPEKRLAAVPGTPDPILDGGVTA